MREGGGVTWSVGLTPGCAESSWSVMVMMVGPMCAVNGGFYFS